MPDPDTEAQRLLACYGNGPDALGKGMERLTWQFTVMQGRSQLLLTLGTITLTITGFSGPRIAESSHYARAGLGIGLFFVLLAMLVLLGNLRIRWLSEFLTGDAQRDLSAMIHYRNGKARSYRAQITLIGAGLIFYVGSIILYLIQGSHGVLP